MNRDGAIASWSPKESDLIGVKECENPRRCNFEKINSEESVRSAPTVVRGACTCMGLTNVTRMPPTPAWQALPPMDRGETARRRQPRKRRRRGMNKRVSRATSVLRVAGPFRYCPRIDCEAAGLLFVAAIIVAGARDGKRWSPFVDPGTQGSFGAGGLPKSTPKHTGRM